MSPDEARDRFSDALDDLLSEDERRAFERALCEDAELEAEYRGFREVVEQTRALRQTVPRPSVDLLAGVHERLRARGRGRFHRDRFASARNLQRFIPVLVAVLMLLLLGVAYAGLQLLQDEVEPAPDAPATSEP